MTRVLVSADELRAGEIELVSERAHYLRVVLRLGAGDAVELFDGAGQEAAARVVSVSPAGVRLTVELPRPSGAVPRLPLELIVSLSKGEKMEWVIEKATELGVADIRPAAARRSIVQLREERAASRVARWQRIAQEAARQCGRADVPRVGGLRSLEELLAATRAEARLLFHEKAEPGAYGVLSRPAPASVAVAVGPEGGFSPEEVALAARHGFEVLSMGPRILRAETAAVIAVALVQHAWGDLR